MSLAEEIARRGVRPNELIRGQVVFDSGTATLNIRGVTVPAEWAGNYVPINGDAVEVLLRDDRAVVLGPVASAPRPETGTITAVGGTTVTVDIGGTATTCAYSLHYSPTVGDTVELGWWVNPPYVLGKRSFAPSTPSAPAPPAAPPTQQAGQSAFVAIESRSFRDGGWRTDTDDVVQGDTAEYPGHANSGAWFYGTAPMSLAGKTVTRCRIYLAGRSSEVATPTVHLYRHTSTSRPSGDVSRVEGPSDHARDDKASGYVDLPVDWGQDIVNSGGGIGITGESYTRLWGLGGHGQSGQLVIDWTT